MNIESLPLIVEPAALNALLPNENLLVLAVCQQNVYLSHHIAKSVLIQPSQLVSGINPATGKIPTAQQLSRVFSNAGLRDDVHVIVYDDEGGGWAGRLIWTLDVIGHRNYSYLNGGLIAWFKLGLPLLAGNEETATMVGSNTSAPEYPVNIDHSQIVDIATILNQIDDPQSIVWDARSKEEYDGTRITAQRNGHIPGAANLDWLELIDRENDWRLLPLTDIATKLEALGISKDKSVITHCQTHHRSGLTYLVGKALGYNIKAYDGSWSEWGNRADTPIEQ